MHTQFNEFSLNLYRQIEYNRKSNKQLEFIGQDHRQTTPRLQVFPMAYFSIKFVSFFYSAPQPDDPGDV